jgi:hypothetical protein
MSMEDKLNDKSGAPEVKTTPAQPVTMVPLLHRRSIKMLIIGLIGGIVLGLFLYIISPFVLAGGKVWESKIDIQAVNPGSSYLSLSSLQSRAEYYATKIRSLPFIQYLSEDLKKGTPPYNLTVKQLNRMIITSYNQYGSSPVINIGVSTPSDNETSYLVYHIPEAFMKYIAEEDAKKRQADYQATLDSIDNVQKALVEAEQEISDYKTATSIENDAQYISLTARITSLEDQLAARADAVTNLTVTGYAGTANTTASREYAQFTQQAKDTGIALIQAETELVKLEEQRVDTARDATIITLNAKINALQLQLDRLMTGYTDSSFDPPLRVQGLAEMISSSNNNTMNYNAIMKQVEATTKAISEAKKQLSIEENQLGGTDQAGLLAYKTAQTAVDNLKNKLATLNDKMAQFEANTAINLSPDEIRSDFEKTSTALSEAKKELAVIESRAAGKAEDKVKYEIARSNIDTLNRELTDLNASRASYLSNSGTVDIQEVLAVGKPSVTAPVVPLSLPVSLLGGIIIGLCGGWSVLNHKWLIKVLSSSPEDDNQV